MIRYVSRAWQWCFLATLVVYLLQLYPPTGLFLMLVGAALWLVVFVNLGFVLLAWDVLTGQVPRWVMGAPLLWFGGYAIAAGLSHWQAHRFLAGIDDANRGRAVAWNVARDDVLIMGDGLNAQPLIEQHGLTRVYTRRRVGRDGLKSRVTELTRYCPRPAVQHGNDGATVVYLQALVQKPGRNSRWRAASNVCIMTADASPQGPAVTVTVSPPAAATGWLVPTHVQPVTIRTPNGRVYRFRSGDARPLAWWPQPILGCGLNSGSPRWECFTGFNRSGADENGARSAQAVMVAALNLPTLTLEQRIPDAGWH